MPKRLTRIRNPVPAQRATDANRVLEQPGTSVLDLLDRLLNKGVLATGDITLGVAGVDLIYLRLSALLCASDRVLARPAVRPRRTAARPRRRHQA